MIMELFIMINSLRLNPLVLDDNLSKLAVERAKVVEVDWSHDNWRKSFYGTGCQYTGENLAKGFYSPTMMTGAFLNSPAHLNNMVKKEYDKIGIGVYNNIVVELFCGTFKATQGKFGNWIY